MLRFRQWVDEVFHGPPLSGHEPSRTRLYHNMLKRMGKPRPDIKRFDSNFHVSV